MSFELDVRAKGKVFDVSVGKENKDAKLQFLQKGERGSKIIDVKILGARKEDLEQFINKNVVVKNIEIVKVDFNTYYKTSDISNIQILEGGKK